MKGILLAGGSGSRLYPLTLAMSKQLMPVYDKPMIYYPLSTLMLADITEILIISTERDLPLIQALLGNGSQFGLSLSYKVQPSPNGLAQAFILGEKFLQGEPGCLVLGDNIYHGQGFVDILLNAKHRILQEGGACIFGYYVQDPERYGVVEFDAAKKVRSIEEKPIKPKSHYAITGLYFYDAQVTKLAKQVAPSDRGELEITDLNQFYLDQNKLNVQLLGRGFAWMDAGTHDSLLEASQYVAAVENRQGLKIGCPEEIAWRKGFIDNRRLERVAAKFIKTDYGHYLKGLLREE
jgi:glucose-1-phosphate thymidylyltransferase